MLVNNPINIFLIKPNIILYHLKMLFWAYNLIIKRITRSAIVVENNIKDVNLVKTNISSLAFINFTFLVLVSTLIALLVLSFIKITPK